MSVEHGTSDPTTGAGEVVDLVGIGFGPANLAVGIAWDEMAASSRGVHRRPVFFERQPAFGWHKGMLVDGASMQVSFLKDLVTMRDPRSPFSFVSYLHAHDRLADFINLQTMLPSRIEFHDYLEWAAAPFVDRVWYGTEVVDVRPVIDRDRVVCLDVVGNRSSTGETVVQRTRNVVIGTGSTPVLPEGVTPSERVWHNSELMRRVDDLSDSRPARVFVVGAGQSAAEVASLLHERCRTTELRLVFSRYGYSRSDDNPFANRIFDPAAVDVAHGASDNVRQLLLDYHANTNYSVVEQGLCHDLYKSYYEERLPGGAQRLRIMNLSVVRAVEEHPGGVRVDVEYLPTGEVERFEADAVVYATGYRPTTPVNLLNRIASECKFDQANRFLLDRRFRVVTSDALECSVYLHGSVTEASHGISAGLLSTTAVRSGEIMESVLADSYEPAGDNGVRTRTVR